MPSSYTSSLRLTLPATGENNGTWGSLVNTGITQLIEDALAGYASVAMSDANYTLTTSNGATDEARNMYLNMTGALTASRNVICPTVEKLYFIKNSTTGGQSITLKTAAGSGVIIPNARSMVVLCDGTNVVDAITNFSSLQVADAPVYGTGKILLVTQTASGSTSLDFTTNITSTYDAYEFELVNIVPASNGAHLYIRTSTNAGSSWDSGGSDYQYAGDEVVYTDTSNNPFQGQSSVIDTSNNGISSNPTHGGINGTVKLFAPAGAAYKHMTFELSLFTGALLATESGSAIRLSATALNGVRFLASTGNLTSGSIRMYGIRKT